MDQKWEVKDQVYPMVIKADGIYLMLYGCYWADDKHTALGFAVSRDGLTWTKPSLDVRPGTNIVLLSGQRDSWRHER